MKKKKLVNTGIIRTKEGKFKKGTSGNPKGKPLGAFSLLAILKHEIQKCPVGEDKKTYAQLIVTKMLNKAMKEGDDQKIKIIFNYIEGMPRQGIDMTHTLKDILTKEQVDELFKNAKDSLEQRT